MAFRRAHRESIEAIKNIIIREFEPDAIILFGSQARGDADEFSDIDLVVVTAKKRDPQAIVREIMAAIEHIAMEKHVIVRSPMSFFAHKDVPGAMVWAASREGKVLYEKDGFSSAAFHLGERGERKRQVVEEEYVRPVREYLAQARAALKREWLYRSRDMLRFAAVRALKGIFVKHDLHPPRDIDVVAQLEGAAKLEPGLRRRAGFAGRLNTYCPDPGDPDRAGTASRLLAETLKFVEEVLGLY